MNQRMAGDTSPAADYEQDFVLWLERQAVLLRARQFELLDLENLVEEIDGMARSVRRELRDRIKVVLIHLLKCEYQSGRLSDSYSRKTGCWIRPSCPDLKRPVRAATASVPARR